MNQRAVLQLFASLILFGFAGYLLFGRGQPDSSDQAFYYDLSEKKIFTASRILAPPIKGINDAVEDGVRAVVVSASGNPSDVHSRTIAYLEKFTPELKGGVEAAQAGHRELTMSRDAAKQHRLVKRVDDLEWFPVGSPAGERILNEWTTPSADGKTPVICTP